MQQVATYRVVAHSDASIRWRPVDQDGEPVAATGTPTVTVTRAAGTAVVPTVDIDDGDVTVDLTAAQTATLDVLTVTVALDGVTRGAFTVEVYARPLVTVTEVRDGEPSLGDVVLYPDVTVRQAVARVDAMFQRACGHVLSFVPRFATSIIQQQYRCPVTVPHYLVRSFGWARYEATAGVWSAVDITDGVTFSDGYAHLNAGWWPYGRVQVGYVHGMDTPPEDVRAVAVMAVRRMLNRSKSAIDPRAMSYTNREGETQRFATPGLGPWVTGVPEIDEVLAWYRERYPVLAVA